MWNPYLHEVTVQRADRWARFRRLKICVDGVVVARLWRGQSVDVTLEPEADGVLILKMDWAESVPFDLRSLRGESVLRIVDDAASLRRDMGIGALPYAFEVADV